LIALAANLQDFILNHLRKGKFLCTIHLTNGYQLKNVLINAFDNFSILILSEGTKQMLLYKHAVSSITPSVSIPLGQLKETKEYNEVPNE